MQTTAKKTQQKKDKLVPVYAENYTKLQADCRMMNMTEAQYINYLIEITIIVKDQEK